MEMCYDGALVMPSNYAVMDSDEMTYVNGGANGWWNSTWFIAGSIDAILYLVPFIAQCNAATKWGKSLGAAVRAVGSTKTALINGAFNLLKKVGLNVSKNVVTGVVGAVWNFAGLSIGGLLAMGIDRIDSGRNNGFCFG